MREFLKSNVRLVVAALLGLVLFLGFYHLVFMGEVRPQPLDRDELTTRALEFAALEGWNDPDRFTWAIPIEGDDMAAVRAAGGDVSDREALPDPAWEVGIVTDPQSLSRIFSFETPPDPLLLLALTPAGEVVQYVEASSPLSSQPLHSISRSRPFPASELDISRVFEIEREDRLSVGDEERAIALTTASRFFERHGIETGGGPTSLQVREGENKARVWSLAWERPGPGGTSELTRVAVLGDRVAAYDRNLRAGVPPAATGYWTRLIVQVIPQVGFMVFLIGTALIAVLVALKKRQGEIDLIAAVGVFVLYTLLSLLDKVLSFGIIGAAMMMTVGFQETWVLGWIPTLIVIPMVSIASGLLTAGAWAVGESESYAVWPQQIVRRLSAIMRGRLRSRAAVEPVAIGYLLAFVGLGLTVVIGIVAPAQPTASVAPIMPLATWPLFLSPAMTGLTSALSIVVVANTFVMTYVKRWARRTWVAVAVATLVSTLLLSIEMPFPVEFWTSLVMTAALGLAASIIFLRFGALASLSAVFVYLTIARAYPLMLVGNSSHAASAAWAIALAFIPAGIVAYSAWRPREEAESPDVPSHVRRVLDRLRITEEFEVARRVQAGLLPASAPAVRGLDVAGLCIPANEVGGDYFDYFRLADDRLAIAIGDVSGKGVPAAIFMTLTKSYMVTQTPRTLDPVRVLARVNSHLKRNLARGTFVTMAYAILDTEARSLTYSRAGHNPPLLIRADGEGDFLTAPGIALGSAASTLFETLTHAETVELRAGDLLLLYTDGVTEAMNGNSQEYGEERLVERAVSIARSAMPASEAADALLKDVRLFTGRAPQHDDITIVAVRVSA